jgi:transposase InsO family protein
MSSSSKSTARSSKLYEYKSKENMLNRQDSYAQFNIWLSNVLIEITLNAVPRSLAKAFVSNAESKQTHLLTTAALIKSITKKKNSGTDTASKPSAKTSESKSSTEASSSIENQPPAPRPITDSAENDNELSESDRFSLEVYQFIYNSLSIELKMKYTYISKDDPLQLVIVLKQLFQSKYARSSILIRNELNQTVLDIAKGEEIYPFYSRLMALKDELMHSEHSEPNQSNESEYNRLLLSAFVNGLRVHKEYFAQATQLMAKNLDANNRPVPIDLGELVDRVALYENQLRSVKQLPKLNNGADAGTITNPIAFSNQFEDPSPSSNSTPNPKGGNGNGNRDKVRNQFNCTFCNKQGHTADRCWENPDSQNYRPNRNRNGGNKQNQKNKKQNPNQNRNGQGNASALNTRTIVQCDKCNNPKAHPAEFCKGNISSNSTLSNKFAVLAKSDNDQQDSDDDENTAGSYLTVAATVTSVAKSDTLFAALDSGATHHFFNNQSYFTEIQELNEPLSIIVATDRIRSSVTISGTVQFMVNDIQVTLYNAIYAPSFKSNLISVSQLTKHGVTVTLNRTHAELLSNRTNRIIRAEMRNGLYMFPITRLVNGNHNINQSNITALTVNSNRSIHASSLNANIANARITESQLWHQRCGHLSYQTLSKLFSSNGQHYVDGLNGVKLSAGTDHSKCEACLIGKQNRKQFKSHSSAPPITSVLDMVCADIAGPIRARSVNDDDQITIPSLGHYKYLLVTIDVYSHKHFGRLLKQKSESAGELIKLIKLLQTSTERKVKVFHSDGGGEFKSTEFINYLVDNGTEQTFTTPNTPQHNGTVERANRTIFEMVRSMLAHAKLPPAFWGAASLAAIHIMNHTMVRNDNKTAEELFTKLKPNIKLLRVFGCNAYIHVHDQNRVKLDDKSEPGIMIGYGKLFGCYVVLRCKDHSLIVTRDVEFDESLFTHAAELNQNYIFNGEPNYESAILTEDVDNPSAVADLDSDYENENYSNPLSGSRSRVNHSAYGQSIQQQQFIDVDIGDNGDSYSDMDVNQSDQIQGGNDESASASASASDHESDHTDPMSSSNSQQNSPNRTQLNFNNSNNNDNINKPIFDTLEEKFTHELQLLGSKRNRKPVQRPGMINHQLMDNHSNTLAFGDQLNRGGSRAQLVMAMNTFVDNIPLNYNQAIVSPNSGKWKLAMDSEINSLHSNQTWKLVRLPPPRKAIKVRWVYDLKYNSDGSIERYKARLVAKGFTQKEGIDYTETFSPVVKSASLRIILTIACKWDYELKQFDVETAFLNAKLNEEIYVEQPDGYAMKGKENWVYLLNKSLYGLKQASHDWYEDLNRTLIKKLGYTRSVNDQCVYYRLSRTNKMMYITVYVDDGTSAYHRDDEAEWLEIKSRLLSVYKIKDLGDAEWILKMRIIRDRKNRALTLDQELYIDKIIDRFNMDECDSKPSPASTSLQLSKSQCPEIGSTEHREMAHIPYLPLIGSLLYAAMITRIDICWITIKLGQYNANPGLAHWTAGKRVLRYLKGTKQAKLVFNPTRSIMNINSKSSKSQSEFTITAFCDSDWAGDGDDSRSTGGHIIKLDGCPVIWTSRKQKNVSLSTAEAEVMAAANLGKDLIWVRALVKELTMRSDPLPPSRIFCDNKSAIHILKNNTTSSKTKHVVMKYHFLKECLVNKEMEILYIPTLHQQADILTKALPTEQHQKLRALFMKD